MDSRYYNMTKEQLLGEVENLKKTKPEKWKWTAKGILNHLAWRDGVYDREREDRYSELVGRKTRNPQATEPLRDDFSDESEP